MTTIETYTTNLNEDYIRDPNNKVWNLNAKHRAINKGYTKVQSDLWRAEAANENNDTRVSVAGSELYELPSDFVRVALIRYDWDALHRTTRKQTRIADETPQSGTPTSYYIYNGKLGLYPVPDAVKTIDLTYYEQEATLSTEQDSQLPSICDDAIVLYAAYKLYLGVRDANSATVFLQDYEREINKLRMSLLFDDENMRMKYERASSTAWDTVLEWSQF